MDIKAVQHNLREFYKERDWAQFHDPKNLIMALVGEVGELSEIFQWLTSEQSQKIMSSAKDSVRVEEEMADVFVYLISLADKLDIDLIAAAEKKIEKNRAKYPIDKSRGNSKKYSEF